MSEESKQNQINIAKLQADTARETAKTQSRTQIIVAIIGAAAVIIAALLSLKSSSHPISPPEPICPYQGQTENETIANLIQAEATAVNTKDLAIIMAIFDASATFQDYASEPPQQWNGALTRYKETLFQTTEFRGVEHFDILPAGPGIDGNTAYYTSGSKGSYRIGGGDWQNFFNSSLISVPSARFGSDHWILRKNDQGCWVIVRPEFNAGHIEFP